MIYWTLFPKDLRTILTHLLRQAFTHFFNSPLEKSVTQCLKKQTIWSPGASLTVPCLCHLKRSHLLYPMYHRSKNRIMAYHFFHILYSLWTFIFLICFVSCCLTLRSMPTPDYFQNAWIFPSQECLPQMNISHLWIFPTPKYFPHFQPLNISHTWIFIIHKCFLGPRGPLRVPPSIRPCVRVSARKIWSISIPL